MIQDRGMLQKAAERVSESLINASRKLPAEIEEAILNAEPEGGKSLSVLSAIKENLEIAGRTGLPMCQDTGAFWCLASIGRNSDACIGNIEKVILAGAAEASEKGFFRKSIVSDPVRKRSNTSTNLPAFIFYETTEEDDVELSFLLKGFGSENCSSVRMLNPTAGEDGVVNAVVEMMKAAGGKPCPPVFLGIGIGGTMDRAAFLSKKAFFRSSDDTVLSNRILEAVNELYIGPGGLGGRPTALGVSVLTEPTHIAGLPVAMTVNCWAERKAVVRFRKGEI